jgi:poly-gamma-glutamate synthesis protein (capsule biosynthesis protein)
MNKVWIKRFGKPVGYFFAILLGVVGLFALFGTYYNPPVELSPPRIVNRPLSGKEITILMAGDTTPQHKAMPYIKKNGWTFPYSATQDTFQKADVSFFNLEAPVTRKLEKFFPYKFHHHRVEPEAVPAWQWLGLDIASVANNHVKDHRDRGLLDTLHNLENGGIVPLGAGVDEPSARRPVIFDVGGTRIGFLAYLEDWSYYNLYHRIFALNDSPGCARFIEDDVARDVNRLKPLVDVLIVSVHWGRNYAPVTEQQKENARFLASLDVDIVVGHHSHDVQPVQWIDNTLVLYSLGNYAHGAYGRRMLNIGLLAKLHITPKTEKMAGQINTVSLLPILIQNRIVRFKPRRIKSSEHKYLTKFLKESRELGTELIVQKNTIRVVLPNSTRPKESQ